MIGFLILLVAASMAISLFGTLLVMRYAPRLGLVAHPGGRMIHKQPTPVGGGTAIFLGLWLPIWISVAFCFYLRAAGGAPANFAAGAADPGEPEGPRDGRRRHGAATGDDLPRRRDRLPGRAGRRPMEPVALAAAGDRGWRGADARPERRQRRAFLREPPAARADHRSLDRGADQLPSTSWTTWTA